MTTRRWRALPPHGAMVMATFAAVACLRTASAQTSAPAVEVALGPAVTARIDELGRSDLAAQVRYLQQDVERALKRYPGPPPRVHLVIQDIESNRPTSGQLGLSAGLSDASFGLGGAAVTGEVVTANGATQPVRYRFFQDELRNETNFTPWGDADDAFDTVAQGIASGHPPDQKGVWPPPRPPRAPTGTRLVN